jgi:hypothetical protein
MSKTAATTGGDNRRFERVIPDSRAPVRVNINGEDFIELTNAVDISEGGIRINVKHRFAGCAVNFPASFIVHLPHPVNKHFTAKGLIKHVLDDSFGVEFSSLSNADRSLLRRYVASRSNRHSAIGALQNYLRDLFLRFAR